MLDDQTLLKTTHVCQKFKNIAETAVADKYDGIDNQGNDLEHKHYKIEAVEGSGMNETRQHVPFLVAFGDQISSISIEFYPENVNYQWIITLVEKYLHSTSKVELTKSYNSHYTDDDMLSVELDLGDFLPHFLNLKSLTVTHLKLEGSLWARLHCPSLVELKLVYIEDFSAPLWQQFCSNNQQLEHFTCCNVSNLTIHIFEGLNLKTLACENNMDSDETMNFISGASNVNLPDLVTFSTDNRTNILLEVLATPNKNIEKFTVHRAVEPFEISAHQVDIMCSFKKLSKLIMKGVNINVEQVTKLTGELPYLTNFEFFHRNSISLRDVKKILAKTSNSNLSKIRINFELTIKDDLPPMSEIHRLFIDFAKPNLVLVLYLTNMVRNKWKYEIFAITMSKVTMTTSPGERGELICWNGQTHNPLGMNLLQLDDKCLLKIIDYLDACDLLSSYQTCNRMQLLIGPIFQQDYADEPFHICRSLHETEDYLRCFGKYFSRIFFDIKKCIRSPVTSYWNLIHKYCGNNLTELTLRHSNDVSNLSYCCNSGMLFPKLEKLAFQKCRLTIFHDTGMNYSFCPNLIHLEFDENTTINRPVDVNFGTVFNNIKTLRFEWYNEAVLEFIKNLNNVVCHNLRELTLRNIRDLIDDGDDDFRYKLDNGSVNVIARFINLTKLNLIMDGIHQTNVKFLFENCSNLKSLAICHVSQDNYTYGLDTWPIIKKSCVKIQTLQLVTRSLEKRFFETFLAKMFHIFPHITVEILEIGNTTSHQVNRFILTVERFANFVKYPIHSFISGAE